MSATVNIDTAALKERVLIDSFRRAVISRMGYWHTLADIEGIMGVNSDELEHAIDYYAIALNHPKDVAKISDGDIKQALAKVFS